MSAELPQVSMGQAEAQIRAWFDGGLPEGRVELPQAGDRTFWLQMANPSEVAVWAVALGADLRLGREVRTTTVCPKAIHGWFLAVWCEKPVVPVEQRIEVTQ